jgi:hypothetical protein
VDVNYKEINKPKDPEYCESFEEALLTMPVHLMRKYFDFNLYKALGAHLGKKKFTDYEPVETSKG